MKKDTTKRVISIDAIDIHTFACNGDETLLGITTDDDKDIILNFSTYQLLQSLDNKYMKNQLNKYIKGL